MDEYKYFFTFISMINIKNKLFTQILIHVPQKYNIFNYFKKFFAQKNFFKEFVDQTAQFLISNIDFTFCNFCFYIIIIRISFFLTMSIQRRNIQSSQHLNILKNKLKTVDHYIRRSENLPDTLFMHPEVLQHLLKQKTQHQATNQILVKVSKSFLFNQKTIATCYFNYLPIPEDKRYCLKVEPSHTHIQVFIQLDASRKKVYLVKGQKGIIINQVGWKRAQFVLKALTLQKLSVAKVQMNTITVEHKTKIKGIPSQRKVVQNQLKQYLNTHKTQQKIDQILQKRRRKSLQQIQDKRLIRSKTSATLESNRYSSENLNMHLYRTNTGFNQSTGVERSLSPIIDHSKIKSTLTLRDFIVFQDSKQKYIKHLEKMCPQKAKQIQKHKIQYNKHKIQTLQKLASLINSVIFTNKVHKLLIEVARKRMRSTHIHLLCKKFIKKLIFANRTRVPLKTRNKQTLQRSLNLIACCVWQENNMRAQQRIISLFKKQLFKIDILKIGDLSEKYVQTCVKVQRKFRLFNFLYRVRFQVIATKAKKYEFKDQKQKQLFFKRYKKDCYKKARYLGYFFTKNHKYIDEMMKQKQKERFRIL